jgi:hypothetical protein
LTPKIPTQSAKETPKWPGDAVEVPSAKGFREKAKEKYEYIENTMARVESAQSN